MQLQTSDDRQSHLHCCVCTTGQDWVLLQRRGKGKVKVSGDMTSHTVLMLRQSPWVRLHQGPTQREALEIVASDNEKAQAHRQVSVVAQTQHTSHHRHQSVCGDRAQPYTAMHTLPMDVAMRNNRRGLEKKSYGLYIECAPDGWWWWKADNRRKHNNNNKN